MNVVLPDPLGPRTTQISFSATRERQALKCRDAARRGGIDGEEVARVDERVHLVTLPIQRPSRARESSTSRTRDEGGRENGEQGDAGYDEAWIDDGGERRLGRSTARCDRDNPRHEREQPETRGDPRSEPGHRNRRRARANNLPEEAAETIPAPRGRSAPRDRRGDPSEPRERAPEMRARAQRARWRPMRAAFPRERIAPRFGFDVVSHARSESPVRRSCERIGDRTHPPGLDVEPDLVLRAARGPPC